MFEICLRYDPSILDEMEQLSLMSAATAISVDLTTYLDSRLEWLDKILTLVRGEVLRPMSSWLIK